MDVRVARCVLLTKVLVADGIITENERAVLDMAMDKEKLTDDERMFVLDPDHWGDAESVVAKLPEADKRAFVGELTQAASVDGKLSGLEAATLKQITAALGL